MTEEMRLNIYHHAASHQEVSEESGHGAALCVNAFHVHRFPNLISSTTGVVGMGGGTEIEVILNVNPHRLQAW